MKKKIRVAVLFGGRSGEHEVSLRSAASVLAALDRHKYEALPIAIGKSGKWLTAAESAKLLPAAVQPTHPATQALEILPQPGSADAVDVVFPVLHGTFGEDGTVQGLLELAGVPYVGAGVLGSAVAMDKDVMKRLFRERGLPTPEHVAVLREQIRTRPARLVRKLEKQFDYPMFVKPANLGSSVGISKARNRRELAEALELAARFDRKVMIERAIVGREIECSVLGNDHPEASLPGEIIPSREFYDYEAKYIDENSQLIVPAPLTAAQTRRVQRLAVEAFLVCECSGMARVDFFLERKTRRILVNELNTIPGFTSISMYPKLWEASGLAYRDLIDRLIQLALERHAEKARTRYSI
ncbi:MAG: D-alanine--D-alanine ligase [Acidobacteria bacterium]|nr:D-alanine--D-alanine ligase [Acidobacteriota bacterium]